MVFTQIHVSGLPSDCDDAEVEAALRKLCALARHGPSGSSSSSTAAPPTAPEEAEALQTRPEQAIESDPSVSLSTAGEQRPDAQTCQAEQLAGLSRDEPGQEAGEEAEGGDDGGTGGDEGEEQTEQAAEAEEAEDVSEYLDGYCGCVVVRDKNTGSCKGYCFLTVVVAEEANTIIDILNEGSEICGAQVTAQLSRPKERGPKVEKKEVVEDLPDLRFRRKRYAAVGCKKAQMGHMSCSDKSKTMTKTTGRVDAIAGTRGGKPLVLDDGKCSSRSGFKTAF